MTSTRRLELDWLYRGVGRFFPEAWARFRDFADLTGSYRLPTDSTPPISGLLQAYSRMMEDPGIGVRSRAATEWTAWEDAVISQEGNGSLGAYGDRPDDAKLVAQALIAVGAVDVGTADKLEVGSLTTTGAGCLSRQGDARASRGAGCGGCRGWP